MVPHPGILAVVLCSLFAFAMATHADTSGRAVPARALMWAWGNPEMTEPGPHSHATYAQASPAERAALLGVPNIIMAGLGLPDDEAQARRWTAEVGHAQELIWEIASDAPVSSSSFTYGHRVHLLAELAREHPRLSGALLDDMTTVQIDHGLQPADVRRCRELLQRHCPGLKLWAAVYTMSLDRPGIGEYIRELDGITLWTWHARDLPELERNVDRVRREYPGKPLLAGLYLYDYGDGRPMPRDLLEQQCETGLRLLHDGRLQGLVFLTITNDAETVQWVADWVARVGDQPVTAPAGLQLAAGDWHYLAGQWTQSETGEIRPPDQPNLHSRALRTDVAYGDVTVEFEYLASYRETGSGTAGLLLRATGPDRGYLVHFPWGGQQLRAKHFWAAVAKLEGDGFLRHLGAAWVPGVVSETDRWYRVKVEASGPRLRVWVDGREALAVTDETYAKGCLGLAGYGWYGFRDVRVRGEALPATAWNPQPDLPSHHFTIGLSSQDMPSGCVAPNGDVLVAAGTKLVRSTDHGRTWQTPVELPGKLGPVGDYGSTMFRTAAGRLLVMVYRTQEQLGQATPEIAIAESADNGLTWSDPVRSVVAEGWPALPSNLVPYGPLVETADGTLLRFLLGSAKEENDAFTNVVTWSATHCKAFAIRSTDGGATWSAPLELDRPAWSGQARGTIPGSLDLTEPTGVALGNRVMVLVRPIYSPFMWQCWSEDSGANWDAAARATFPGYAQSMVRTQSGAILCAHRYPLYSVNMSRDGGLHWDAGTVIDYPVWAMGCMVEVEPDVVLCTYMNAQRDQPLLAQRLRVNGDRLEQAP
ncbi:MAG: DUF1080 domain-containing protein [Armatimonadetes bacterium]|nr:DUF1080 domain-containing protein [Armatimonadota bacterium]